MATHSSILAWRIPWTEEPGGLQSMGRKESDTTEGLSTFRQQWDHVILNLYGSLNLVWVELLNSHNQVPT